MNNIFKLLCILFIASCAPKPTAEPGLLIDQNKFVEVLTDVRLLEGAYSMRIGRPDTLRPKMNAHYNALFQKHNTTKQHFENSYTYYLTQPEAMATIEDQVIEKLNLLSAQINATTQIDLSNDSTSTPKDSVSSAPDYKKQQ